MYIIRLPEIHITKANVDDIKQLICHDRENFSSYYFDKKKILQQKIRNICIFRTAQNVNLCACLECSTFWAQTNDLQKLIFAASPLYM